MPRSSKPFPFRIDFPPELPISARAEEITATIAAHQVVIIAGETGSGKTTQLPKMCLAAGGGGRGRIACTQPRRVAALSISRRVAEELGVEWGREVGCKIRFSDQTTPGTVIKFLTDGMLLAEMQGDPMLAEYDTIIIDEAHERSLNIDFLIGHLRALRFRRPELKILITSATIDTAAFSAAFDDAPVVVVEGRTYPVSVIYAPLDSPDDWAGPDAVTPGEEGIDEQGKAAERAAHLAERAEAMHYVDGAAEAVDRIVQDGMPGDVLVFLPSERDIREVRDLLEGRRLPNCEFVPLFGRLSNAEQQRVFAPTQRRKVVLATNIAETSLTIPGIRFVVDTGLARMSRYSAQSRTRRLPIEEISQSSADQRKGRSGRVAEGVCIRLYSEKDYLERARFTQPEIQRANLADVILRMKAFGLGDIERFPFINAPSGAAIRSGYALLEELGALERLPVDQRTEDGGRRTDEARTTAPSSVLRPLSSNLTPVGRELARLPVDPTVGRMILQARAEKGLREVIVIAAGLSVQDPRERPLDKQAQADAAHRRFAHPDSDFLTLLKIWETYHDEVENLSQGKLRRFCREHFLSYTRMREWRDIHDQLVGVLRERDEFRMTSVRDAAPKTPPEGISAKGKGQRAREERSTDPLALGTPAYRAIHRSVLAGLLGNIATLDEESGLYKATHDRKVVLFPGSVLFRREAPKQRRTEGRGQRTDKKESPDRRSAPKWIMASEIMETSRLYARTCARLDPAWALELGEHIVRVSHSEPFWNEEGGRVMVKQRTRLYGLELENRAVSYGRINPVHAMEIFIREALVNDTVTYPLDFLRHNRKVREEIEELLTRARDSGFLNLDEAVYRFYAARLLPEDPSRPVVSSVAELVDLVRERRGAEPRFLMMEPGDLRDPETIAVDAEAFPAALPIENTALPLNYTYKPGDADDGVSLQVGVKEAEELTEKDLDWAVPGHLEAKIEHYLRALPKSLRVQLATSVPLAEAAKGLAAQLAARDRLTGRRETLTTALAAAIAERFRMAIDPAVWGDKPLPDHLRVRVRVVDERGRELTAGRDLEAVRFGLQQHKHEASAAVAKAEPEAWRNARMKWETSPQTTWTFGDVPVQVMVTEQAGVPVYAFPGLQVEAVPVAVKKLAKETMAPGVAVRLFKSPEEAAASTRVGIAALLERELSHDLGWLERDLRALREVGPLASTLVTLPDLQRHVFESIRRWVTDPRRLATPSAAYSERSFKAALEQAKAGLRGLVPKVTDLLRAILSARQELLVTPKPPPWLATELAVLLPADFARATPYEQLAHFPRYLKALATRVERWRQNPAKDGERSRQVAPYVAAIERLPAGPGRDAFRWLVEEFKVSVFAQELGTAEPVSAVKLDRALASLGAVKKEEPPVASTAKPIVAATVGAEKKAPLKNLGALDKLFRR